MSERTEVAIVDDDSSVSAMLSRALRHAGLATVTYPSAELLLDALPALAVQCLVVDVDLPGMTGLALLRTLRETWREDGIWVERDGRKWYFATRIDIRRDEDAPFAFMATYTTRLTTAEQAQHLPLGRALKEYAGAANKDRLLSLLLGMPFTLTARFEIEYASATVIDLGPLRTEVQLMNFTPWRDLE